MALAIRDLLLYPELRSRLERLGRRRAAQFSWRETAARTLEIYREVGARRNCGSASRAALTVNR
jgi:glycosyltransferase involved in cell wall biosynthesis